MTPTISFVLSWHKLGVLGDLTKNLKKIDIAKNKQKEIHDIVIDNNR